MATKPQIAVAITARDELSGVLAGIQKRMAELGGEARDLGLHLDKTLEKRGLSPTALGRSVSTSIGRAGSLIPGLGALAGAGSIAGISELVTHYTSMGVTLGNTARMAGTTAQGMNTLRGSARMLGLSTDTADQAMAGLNTTIADAFYGKNPQAAAAFQQFGIGLEGLGGKAKKAEDVLPRIADEVAKIAKVDPRAAVTLMNALGISPEAMPLLMQGAEGLKRYREEVQRLDPITADSVVSSQHFTEAMGRLGIASDRAGRAIVTSLEPHLTPMLTHLSEWVSSHGPEIGETFDHLGSAIQHIEWKQLGTLIEEAGGYAKAAAKQFDDLSQSWAKLNEFGKPVSDFLNWASGASNGGRPMAMPLNHFGAPQLRAMEGATTDRMRNGQLPGPDEGMSIPPRPTKPAKVTETFDTTLTPAARGLLDTIAGTESPGYNTIYGGGRVNDLSKHPNIPIPIMSGPNAGKNSTAAGRYQFLKSTWDEAAEATGVKDFSPASQDKAGWWLAQRDYKARTGRDLAADLKSNDPAVKSGIGNSLHDTWTSLPGGIEAGTTDRRFNAQLDSNTAREERATPKVVTSDAKSETRDFAAGSKPPQSTVQIDINHNGAPHDVTMNAKASGGAEVRQVRVARAMPEGDNRRDR